MDEDSQVNKDLENEIFGADSDSDLSDVEELGALEEEPQPDATTATERGATSYKIPKKTKSEKSRHTSKKDRRRYSSAELDEVEESAPSAPVNPGLAEFDETVAALKNKKRRREELDEASIDEMIIKFIDEMKTAAYTDIDSNKNRQPGTAKLKMLKKVLALMQKSYMHEQLLENMFLDPIRLWLEPLPDGTLPSISIRQDILNLMTKMPISTEHLRESKVGRVVKFYTLCERELPEIRKTATELINAWSQPFVKRPEAHISHYIQPIAASIPDKPAANGLENHAIIQKGVRVPQSLNTTFTEAPDSTVEFREGTKTQSKFKTLTQQMNKSRTKNDTRFNRVSVEGRNM